MHIQCVRGSRRAGRPPARRRAAVRAPRRGSAPGALQPAGPVRRAVVGCAHVTAPVELLGVEDLGAVREELVGRDERVDHLVEVVRVQQRQRQHQVVDIADVAEP